MRDKDFLNLQIINIIIKSSVISKRGVFKYPRNNML